MKPAIDVTGQSTLSLVAALTCFALARVEAQDSSWMPEGIDAVPGVTRVVPDTIINFDALDGRDALGNWEPYTSVVGNRAFLITANTFAEGVEGMQRFALAIQPVDGSEPIFGECFFTDDGEPYRGPINNYRQRGNPARVAGDKRPGAANFITGAEASPNEFEEFRSDGRWELGVERHGRFATVQTFSLELDRDTGRYQQVPRSKAFDATNGRLTEGDPMTDEISRFGGELAGLSNGNFVVVVDDRSRLHDENADKATTAVIIAPDGSVVRDSFVVSSRNLWSNVAAYKGGWVARVRGILHFFDNDGNALGERDQDDPDLVDGLGDPVIFGRRREDASRVASHVNSPYIFIAGQSGENVHLAAYDTRDRRFVAQINVNELTLQRGGTDEFDFVPSFDRVALAVDALDRVVVTYETLPEGFAAPQTVARVIALREDEGKLEHLTRSFFAFVNFDATGASGIRTWRPNPSMTTEAICIAAKGEINTRNFPGDGPDTPLEVDFYTVISHPDPRPDPTPPAPGAGARFIRSDANGDGRLTIADPSYTLNHLFLAGPPHGCAAAADANGDGRVNLSDPSYTLNYLFLGGPAPPAPFPGCGHAERESDARLGCAPTCR